MLGKRPSPAAVSAWTGLVRARQAVLSRVEAELRQAGYPPLAWYDVLLELRRAGGAGLRPRDIEARMLLPQYNVSRLIDRIAGAGYAVRGPCPEDRRSSVVTVTPAGVALLESMWPHYADAIERHVGARLPGADLAALGRMLRTLTGDEGAGRG